MFSWLMGYKQEETKEDKEARKIEEEDEVIPPPPELKREQGYYKSKVNEYGATAKDYKECSIDDVIKWKDYDEEIKKIREELEKLKIDTDKKWEARLSPVMKTRKKRKRIKSTGASIST